MNTLRCLRYLALLLATLLTVACADDVQDYYAHERAFFRFTPVTAAMPLYTAVNSAGEWCKVTFAPGLYTFTSAHGLTATYPATALEAYGQPEYVAGFVVGTPSVPGVNGLYEVAAFDLVCPACYEQNMVQRSLAFTGHELLTCPRCQRVYDLQNGGLQREGEPGPKMYRYHVTYSSATQSLLIIN